MHGGSIQSCLAMHCCPQWETIIGSLSHISKAWVWVGTCPSGCLPGVYHKLPPFYCVSIGRTAVHRGSMYTCLRMHGCSPWETTHWKIVNLSIACRWVGSMPLGLFTMCLSWISACSICFERKGGGGGGTTTHGGSMHRCPPMHGCPPTRNYTLELCCTFQMDLYAQIVCPKGCLLYGQHTLTSIYWVSIGGTAMHEGFHEKLSRHAQLSPMRNHKLEVCSTFKKHVCG